SPDGRRLLLSRQATNADIFELPLDGSAPHKLLATTLPEFAPSWSRKGDEFAYITQRNGTYELWIHSAQGEWDRPVVTGREFPKMGTLAGPAISPDATRVAYMMNFIERRGIYVSTVAGGFPTLQALNGYGPAWSPDGASLAFLWLRPDGASVLATMLL